ncbi:diguanylate cyclase [Candidatus Chloroploca asiatica]|uniref:Diguanylate cyclase n=1 Tax=Candidatus Chloroploca asiatica TaxID=1506545 RepID=A0A2H3KLS2_9CHLR|nr:diguanylate cyclase [Candidatus Chloroploca asiatica]PDV98938.1 hypothetical protein A9Q02_14490 [Candidatus Chloroploca asiatica]
MSINSILIFLLAVSSIVAFLLALYALRHRAMPGAVSFSLMLGGQSAWAAFALGKAVTPTLTGQLIWDSLIFLAVDLTVVGALLFALSYTGRQELARRLRYLLMIIPFLNVLIIWSDGFHGLVRTNVTMLTDGAFPWLFYSYGPWFWVITSYQYLLIGSAILILAEAAAKATRYARLQAWALPISLLLPTMISLLVVMQIVPVPAIPDFEVSPISFLVGYPIMGWSIFYKRLFELMPIAYDMLFEKLPDSVLILDEHNQVVAMNQKAYERLGAKQRLPISLTSLLPELGPTTKPNNSELFITSLSHTEANGKRVLYEAVITRLHDRWGRVGGMLVVLRDITTQAEANEALRESEGAFRELAFEHARLYEEARKRADQVETLRQAVATVAATLDANEAVGRMMEQLAHVVPYDSASVQLRRGEYSEIFDCRGFAHPAQVKGLRFQIKPGSYEEAIYERAETIRLDNTELEHPEFTHPPGMIIRSWLALPLIVGERVIGILTIDSQRASFFTEEDASIGRMFASHVAVSLEQAQMYGREVRMQRRLTKLQQAARQIAANSANPAALFHEVYRAVEELLAAEVLVISRFDLARSEVCDLYIADPRESREGSCYAFAHSFAETLLNRGQTWCLTHLNDTELHPELPGFRLATRTVLATLLHGREDVIGMMVIHSPQAFAYSDDDLAIFDLLASHVATAMENCTLFAEVERLATTDPLTGLANRRHFFAVMWQAILNARRQRQPLTLLLLDLDHFKLINDTYGHQAGDRVLQCVAQTCQACVRAEDLVGRYGGEELSVLMPSTNLEGAARVAERIRHAIESLRVQFDEQEIQVTSSIGVVVETCLHNTHLDELINRADQALYAAKDAGRNCVQIWGETESRSLEQTVP